MSTNNRKRWTAPWKDSRVKPAIYHCISRVVDRRFALGEDEREHFRMLMRMGERFTGCRVLSYCVMSNHFHILLEVPPMPEEGICNEDLFRRLGVFYNEAQLAEIAKEMEEAAVVRKRGEFEMPPVDENGLPLTGAQERSLAKRQAAQRVEEIRSRHTRRMHDLSEFMKSLLERFTKWFNRTRSRSGTLWEDRFKSVIVESGVAARTMAAYIDLNPVRAGMASDPADYRWSSYGEAIGGGRKGDGKKAREGLVRAWDCDEESEFRQGAGNIGTVGTTGNGVDRWREVSRLYRRLMGIALGKNAGKSSVEKTGRSVTKNSAELLDSEDNETVLKDLGMARLLRCRVRYFTDGVVIGSREFVNEVFSGARERFGPKRKDGARKMRGEAGAAAAGLLWSARDLRKGVET